MVILVIIMWLIMSILAYKPFKFFMEGEKRWRIGDFTFAVIICLLFWYIVLFCYIIYKINNMDFWDKESKF